MLARGGVVRLGGAARMTGDPLALVEIATAVAVRKTSSR